MALQPRAQTRPSRHCTEKWDTDPRSPPLLSKANNWYWVLGFLSSVLTTDCHVTALLVRARIAEIEDGKAMRALTYVAQLAGRRTPNHEGRQFSSQPGRAWSPIRACTRSIRWMFLSLSLSPL